MDILPLVKMRKVKGQMEGLTIAEKEQPVSFREECCV